MKEQIDLLKLIEENKNLKKTIKRIYLALNPRPKAPNKGVVVQWTPKEEAIVKEEVKNHGSVHRAFLAITARGVRRTEGAIKFRWHNKLKGK